MEEIAMDYEEFEELRIEISSDGEGGYRAAVVESPYEASPDQPLMPPYPPETVARLLRELVAGSDSAIGASKRELGEETESNTARSSGRGELNRDVGSRLCQALFSGPLAAKLLLSLGLIDGFRRAQQRRGLRLRLIFGAPGGVVDETDLRRGELNLLAALPWESLFEANTARYLGVGDETTLVRSLRGSLKVQPLPVSGRLKVLLVAGANPDREGKPLDLTREQRNIKSAIEATEVADVEIFQGHRLRDLRRTLEEEGVHVLHFMGHGRFRQEEGAGGLLFADGSSGGAYISGRELAAALKGLSELRLVVLNACRGAQVPYQPDCNPFLGVAYALIAAGVPAVVAMQFPISDEGAVDFGADFYESLVYGAPVDVSVGQWRQSVKCSSCEWVTPVVFLAGRTAQVFDPGYLATRRKEMDEEKEKGLLRLGIRSFVQASDQHPPAFARNMERDNDRILSLASSFDGRIIRRGDLWQTKVVPKLERFLDLALSAERPLLLDLAAHMSIAFAAGYYLSINSGLDITVRQRSARGTEDWRIGDGDIPDDPLWEWSGGGGVERGGQDVALAISINHFIAEEVLSLISKPPLQIGRLLSARVPRIGQTRVESGAHAFALAEELAQRLKQRSPEEKQGVLHVFAAVPNAFMFFLGRLARNFGTVQLYEHNFENDPRYPLYMPSIRLPPPPELGGWRG